jgi:uncharacterized protein (DUF433 family)
MRKLVLVHSVEEALANLHRFDRELAKSPELQARLSHVHAWYAARRPDGSWTFGPSKFIGYRNNNAQEYLRTYKRGANGGTTEGRLKHWFEPVDPESPLGSQLTEAVGEFLGRWNHAPRKNMRIKVLTTELDRLPVAARPPSAGSDRLLSRISSDPRICGGRPCIKGTRMRVSDVVDMLAHGAAREEILEDFPYLSEEDIAAALAYAARSTDHRVIRAA